MVTRYGESLGTRAINQAGDFLFTPPDLSHQWTNLSATGAAHAIVAPNTPVEEESVPWITLSAATSELPSREDLRSETVQPREDED